MLLALCNILSLKILVFGRISLQVSSRMPAAWTERTLGKAATMVACLKLLGFARSAVAMAL
jgi:hypothetical protein